MAENQNDHHTEEEGSPILPPELVESILTRLPVKSLLRFKTVSKLWNNIISDSRFMKIQSQTASASFPRRFLVWGCPSGSTDSGTFCLLKFKDQNFQLESVLGCPFGFSIIRCACNGIVLLWGISTSSENYVLWNPCSREYKIIQWKGNVRVNHGLCYDISTDDYKVVFITTNKKYSVYTCKERAWTKINEECPDFHRIRSRGVCVDGKLYWLCYGGQEHGYNRFIYRGLLCYDGALDRCSKVKLPDAAQSSWSELQLVGLKGCLAFVLNYLVGVELWVMEKKGDENSWRKLMPFENLPLHCTLDSHSFHKCRTRLPCPINDTMVMIFIDCVSFVIYDTSEEKVIGDIQKYSEQWDSMLVPCEDHLYIPIQN